MQTLEKKQNQQSARVSESGERKHFLALAFLSALLIFVLLNLFLLYPAGKLKRDCMKEVLQQTRMEKANGLSSKHSWPWWLTKFYAERSEAPDIVCFGSSLLGSAHSAIDATYERKLFDTLTHRRMSFFEYELERRLGRHVSVFSLASPGEMISDAYVVSRALISEGKKPKLVIASIAPRDFVDATLAFPAATDHYKFFSKFLDLQALRSSAYPSFIDALGYEIEKLPLRAFSRHYASRYVEPTDNPLLASEILRIQPGQSLVPAAVVPAPVDNSQEYVRRFANPLSANYESEMKFFRSWISELRRDGIEVMVVCMPTTESNRKLLSPAFWERFRADIAAVCKQYQADWYDLSDVTLFQNGDYLDTVHLNAYGAARLFPVLAERICMKSRGIQKGKHSSAN